MHFCGVDGLPGDGVAAPLVAASWLGSVTSASGTTAATLGSDARAARVPLEVLDARDLEPHEVVRVVRDALRVGLREADADRC